MLFLLFFVCWYILSGENKEFFLIAGVFSSIACVFIANKVGSGFVDARYNIGVIGYGFWLLKEIAISAWQVTKVVWSPKAEISPKFASIATYQDTDLGQVTYANSITLTPGTITVEVDSENNRILVHALQSRTVDDLSMEGVMDKKISKIIKAAK